MRLQRLAFSGSVFMAAAGVATTTAEGQEAGGVSRPAPFVPTLQLSGSSSSSADFRAGFDYVRGPWPDWDIALTPVFATQTKNGVTNLFALKNSGTGVANPWFLGLSISFIDLDPDIDANSPAAPQSERDVLAQVKTEVFNQCNEACRWNSKSRSDVECKSFDLHGTLSRAGPGFFHRPRAGPNVQFGQRDLQAQVRHSTPRSSWPFPCLGHIHRRWLGPRRA
jgi:hypothetical protein